MTQPTTLGSLYQYFVELNQKPSTTKAGGSTTPPSSTWSIETCFSEIATCFNTPFFTAASPCMKAFTYCTSIDHLIEQITDPTQLFTQASAGASSAMETTKQALQKLVLDFFKLCNLPPLPLGPQNSCIETDLSALGVIAAFVALQPFATNTYYKEKTQIASSINKGVIAGTAMAWIFDQSLYGGAITGGLAGAFIDPLCSWILKPVTTFLNDQYQKPYIKDTFEEQANTMKYFLTIPIIGLVYYSGIGTLFSITEDSWYSKLIMPTSLLLTTGTCIYLLKRPVEWAEGILKQTWQLAGRLSGMPQIPFIAYVGLSLNLHRQSLLQNSYTTFWNLYNEASKTLLSNWNSLSQLDPNQKNRAAFVTLCLLAGGAYSYIHSRKEELEEFQTHTIRPATVNTNPTTNASLTHHQKSPIHNQAYDPSRSFSPEKQGLPRLNKRPIDPFSEWTLH